MARVLIASDYNSRDRAHFSVSYEFCQIVSECDDADLIAPGVDQYLQRRFGAIMPQHDDHNVQRDFNRLVNGARKRIGLGNRAIIEPTAVTKDYDLFFYVAWSPQSLVELERITHWRERCRTTAVYLFELWDSTLAQDTRYLKLLNQFDHVFLLHRACVPHLNAYTSAKCSWLPPGVDCLTATPYPSPPERVIDVYSIGNRAPEVHRQLVELSRRGHFFYLYDSLSSTDSRVKDWGEHRLLLANVIKRSRYFITFNPATLSGGKREKIAGEQVLPSRLFEGAAGGAVMIGTAPQCPEFLQYFPWDDAVIELDPGSADIAKVINDLEANPERVERIRKSGTVACLLRHDWAYRWERILHTLGVEALPRLGARLSKLADLAAAADRSLRRRRTAQSLLESQL